jgi:hypothetical protein
MSNKPSNDDDDDDDNNSYYETNASKETEPS